jgi:hypothetical protein
MRTLLFCVVSLGLFAQDKVSKNIDWYKNQLSKVEKEPTDTFCQTFEAFLRYKELQNQFLKSKLYNPLVETALSSGATIVGRKASALGVKEFRTKGEVSCITVHGDRDINRVIKPIMDLATLQFVRENGVLTEEEKRKMDEMLGPLVRKK